MQPRQDARNGEHTVFDYVLCDQYFGESGYSGQTLLDDLRRAQLLPFSTVFFMVTSEASYAAVAEAAESALDGYLLKPFTPSALFERLSLARLRKVHLRPIFDAIEAEDFESAARLCVARFEARQPYWLYAARIGSELLLLLARMTRRARCVEAVIAARALPGPSGRGACADRVRPGGARHNHLAGADWRGCLVCRRLMTCSAVRWWIWATSRRPRDLSHGQRPDAGFGVCGSKAGNDVVLHGRPRNRHQSAVARRILASTPSCSTFSRWCCSLLRTLPQNDRKGIERCWPTSAASLNATGQRAHPAVYHCGTALQLILSGSSRRRWNPYATSRRDHLSSFDFEAACNLALAGVLAAHIHRPVGGRAGYGPWACATRIPRTDRVAGQCLQSARAL